MLTKQNKAGLILAAILAVSDIAILFAYLGDGDHPPVAIAVISVIIGIAGLALVYRAWNAPTRSLMLALIGVRVLSGLGDVGGLGEGGGMLVGSIVLLILTLVDLYLLRNWVTKRSTMSVHPQPA